jgi:3-oxoacyl-[acyl-carrier protein] reductase
MFSGALCASSPSSLRDCRPVGQDSERLFSYTKANSKDRRYSRAIDVEAEATDRSRRVALVTGASRGIGFAIASALRAEGHRVVITARRAEALDEAAARLGNEDTLAVAGNSADPVHRREAVAATIAHFGRIDLLVNNTGINPVLGPLVEAELRTVTKTLDTNVVATLGWVQEIYHAWMGEHGGAIVNVASVGGLGPGRGSGIYGMSKAAVIHLTRQLATELAPSIRVNAVAPAVIKTRFSAALYEDRESEVAAHYPLQRLGTPEDVAAAVVFLASSDAGWITGHTLVLDGGVLSAFQRDSES